MQLYFYKIIIKYVRIHLFLKKSAGPPRRFHAGRPFTEFCVIFKSTQLHSKSLMQRLWILWSKDELSWSCKRSSPISSSEKLTVQTQKIQDRYRIILADPTYVITFDEVMKNILTTQNIRTEQQKAIKKIEGEKMLYCATDKTAHRPIRKK